MAITQALCTSFKQELLTGTHDLTATTGDVFKMALYTSSATLDATTTVYSSTNEVSGTNYNPGGVALTNVTPASSGTVAYAQFANPTFVGVTVTARGALIYNASKANRAVCVLDFGTDKTVTAADFEVPMPAANATTALIRLA